MGSVRLVGSPPFSSGIFAARRMRSLVLSCVMGTWALAATGGLSAEPPWTVHR